MNTLLVLLLLRRLPVALVLLGILFIAPVRAARAASASTSTCTASRPALASDDWSDLRTGDIVFIHSAGPLFGQIATLSNGWVNHVGIIVGRENGEWIVAESAVPYSRLTPLSRFIRRSTHHQYAIKRLKSELTPAQLAKLSPAVTPRLHKVYDFGFNLDATHSEFCSKFVYQVVRESSGQELGDVQAFRELLAQNPQAPIWFWRTWYFGRIPWDRRTITPESQFQSPLLVPVRAST